MNYPDPVINYVGKDLKPHQVITPKGVPQAVVDPEFQKAVLLHVTKNYLSALQPSLMLAIQGNAGEGKSFQVREICSQAGIYVIPLSGAMLAGPYEGEATSIVSEAYCFASAVRESTNRMAILLIDDFDLSVAAAIDGRRYTVNTQLLSGFLMNLADDPGRCGTRATARIPIILTGNNFQSLHGPLTRHGRMNFFEWSPSLDQKEVIVRHIFSGVLRDEELSKIHRLIGKFRDEPISFFAALREDLLDDAIYGSLSKGILSTGIIEEVAVKALKGQTLDKLIYLGQARERRSAKDFLR